MISEQTIQQAAHLLGEAAKPAKVILFGSYARGDAQENSDLDFLVIEPELHDKFNEMVRLRQVLRPLRLPVDVLVYSQAEINQQQGACSTAVYCALREGRVLYDTFEAHTQQAENGIEFWLARDLQHLLGYDEWRNFTAVINKAKTACEVSNHAISDHFVDVNKMVDLGSGSQREVDDIMLTRYACYLIAQNGDPRKQQIAFAQTYFAMQTRKAEQIEQRLLEAERISARKKLTTTEKELSEVIYEQTGSNQNFALIRSKGDQALFGKNTQAMKSQWKVPGNRPLADFAPTIILD